jgi:hypothetical protein
MEICGRVSELQGLKPASWLLCAAWLKPCPDTNLFLNLLGNNELALLKKQRVALIYKSRETQLFRL